MSESWEDYLKQKRSEFGIEDIKIVSPIKKVEDIKVVKRHAPPAAPVDRWAVYKLTLPIKFSKLVATGFESKEDAARFIKMHMSTYDADGNYIPQVVHQEDGNEYTIVYEIFREAQGPLDLYYNDNQLTTVGRDIQKIEDRWLN